MRYERLSDQDTEILRLESSRISGHMVKVLVLDAGPTGEPPTLGDLRAHIEGRLEGAPRLRQRLLETPLGIANPIWVDDDSFRIADHVNEIEAGEEVDEPRMRELIAAAIPRRLERRRPLWAVDYVRGLEGGGAAIIWRIHHCVADGVTALRLAERIFWDGSSGEDGGDRRPGVRGAPIAAPPDRLELLRLGVDDRLRAARRTGGRFLRAAASTAPAARSLRVVTGLPRALARELAPSGDETPLDRHPSPRRRVSLAAAEIADMKGVGRSFGEHITVNDVLLATVAGGLRRWLESRDRLVSDVRVKVPVSLHRDDPQPGLIGNYDSAFFVDLPVAEADPIERLQAINRETAERKRLDDPQRLETFMRGLAHVSKALEHLTEDWEQNPHVFSLSISNIPGPREPVAVIGMPVRGFYSLPEIGDRHALRVSALSVAGTLFYGLNADAEAVPDLDVITAGIEAELSVLKERAS